MTDSAEPGVLFEHFASTDLAEAEAFFRSTYTSVDMRQDGDVARFECRHDTAAAAGVAISRLRTPAFSAEVAPLDGLLVVGHVHTGAMTWRSDAHGELLTATGMTAAAPLVGEFSLIVDRTDMDIITLDAGLVADYAGHACGIDPQDLRITDAIPISPVREQHWLDCVAHLRNDVLADPVTSASRIVVDGAVRLLAAALLAAFPNTALDATDDPGTPSVRGQVPEPRVREVEEYLRTHADRTIGPADIADVAGMPAREIVEGMRRQLDTHPSELLWRARLHGVRRSLVDADPDADPGADPETAPGAGRTVDAIAAAWGFARPSGFRVAYRTAFGEPPEDTLSR